MSTLRGSAAEHWEWGRYGVLARRARFLSASMPGPQRIVAFALRRNRVVSVGLNSYTKTHPKQSLFARLATQPKREYLHAEIAALLKAPSDADTLVVIRTDKFGALACAKPCPVCELALTELFPNMRVVHT
jgi:tRNA(Arg) A34 adenosine deaminase TadA